MAKAGEELDNAPPRSVADPNEFRSRAESVRSGARSPQIYSPSPKSKAGGTLVTPDDFGKAYSGSKVNAGRDDIGEDVDSNVQEGVRSEVGEMIPVVRLQSIFLYIIS
jgi:hypothetical protein